MSDEKIYTIKPKPGVMNADGEYIRTIGTTPINFSSAKEQKVDIRTARAALNSGDFELVNPEQAEISLPFDHPSFDLLTKGGFKSLEDIQNATDDKLSAVKGIGKASLKEIRGYTPTAIAAPINVSGNVFTTTQAEASDPSRTATTATADTNARTPDTVPVQKAASKTANTAAKTPTGTTGGEVAATGGGQALGGGEVITAGDTTTVFSGGKGEK